MNQQLRTIGIGLAMCVAMVFVRDARAGERRTAVILYAPALEAVATDWRDYRSAQGWEIVLIRAEPNATVTILRDQVRTALVGRLSDETTALLLLGDVGTDGVPTFSFEQRDPSLQRGGDGRFASDHPYALRNGENESETIAVGRIPVRTPAEAMAFLTKLRAYEEDAPLGAWRHRINYVAGEGHFGEFDRLLESLFRSFIDSFVPDSFDLTMTYAKADSMWCPPPSKLEQTTLERMSEGAILFNYVGHGDAQGLDTLRWGSPASPMRTPILRAGTLEHLPPARGCMPIVLMSCCSTGWFDVERDCLAETMLKRVDGPIAVIAGTRPTHPYGNALFQKEFTRMLIAHADRPLGDIDRLAREEVLRVDQSDRKLDAIVEPLASISRWASTLEELRLMHVRMYALLGDPMMRVTDPGRPISDLRIEGTALRGRIDGMRSGRVDVVIETVRSDVASRELQPAEPGDDIEARTAHNYPRANDRVLWRGNAEMHEDEFTLVLPDPWPARGRIVRVTAVGERRDGAKLQALGAIRLPLRAGHRPIGE